MTKKRAGLGEASASLVAGGGGEHQSPSSPHSRYVTLRCPACGNSVQVLNGSQAWCTKGGRHTPMEMKAGIHQCLQ